MSQPPVDCIVDFYTLYAVNYSKLVMKRYGDNAQVATEFISME